MIRIQIDPFKLGDIAEEFGLVVESVAAPDILARVKGDRLTELRVQLCIGSGRVEFFAPVPPVKDVANVLPPAAPVWGN